MLPLESDSSHLSEGSDDSHCLRPPQPVQSSVQRSSSHSSQPPEKNSVSSLRPKRRSGFQNLLDFMSKYNFNRKDQKRQAVMDLSDTVTAADIARLEEQVKNQNKSVTRDLIIYAIVKLKYVIAFCLWIFLGTLFYAIHDEMGWALGMYQSLSIGFSLGWNLPASEVVVHTQTSRAIITKLFTMLHNIVGVLFSGLAVLYIANDLLHRKKNWISQINAQKKIEKASKANWFWGNIIAYGTYHFPKIRLFVIFCVYATVGTLWCFFSFKNHDEWSFPVSCSFSFSTLSSAGYRTIPDSAESFQFVICAIYAAIGVPLMTISLGLFIGRLFFNHEDITLFEQMAEDVTPKEIETMRLFCDNQEDNQIDNLEFAILIAIRIGAVAPEMIQRIKARFDMLDRNHEHRLAYEDIVVGDNFKTERPGIDRTTVFLKSSFNLQQLVALKMKSKNLKRRVSSEHALLSQSENTHNKSGDISVSGADKGNGKIFPEGLVGRPRGLSFESNGVALSRVRSYSGDGNLEFVRARVRSESGDEIFNAWTKSPPGLNDRKSGLHLNSAVVEDDESLSECCEVKSEGVVRAKTYSNASDMILAPYDENSPSKCMRESFTLSEEEALRLTKRDSGIKWTRNSPRSSWRDSAVLSEDEAMKISSELGDIVWIKSSPVQTQLRDSEVLPASDIRHFTNKRVSDPSDIEEVVARRRPSKTRRASISFNVTPERMLNDEDTSESHSEMKSNQATDQNGDEEVGKVPHSTRTTLATRISKHNSRRTTLMDVVRGETSVMGYLDDRTSSRRLGFHERSEMNNLKKMEKARLHHMRSLSRRESVVDGMWFYLSSIFYDPHIQFLALWLIWLFVGAIIFLIIYQTKEDKDYVMRGFYETVNVGYGLYLTVPEFDDGGYSFTSIHLMLGSVMISGAMAEFARYLNKVNDTNNLKAIHSHISDFTASNKVGVMDNLDESDGHLMSFFNMKSIQSILSHGWQNYPFHFLFSFWLLLMTVSISVQHNWTFFDSLVFSTSVLSTGGFIPLPERASSFDYFVVAIFSIVGVPLMALSLGMFTHYISRLGEQSALVELINAGISPDELSEMEDLEILDDDGHLDIAEYIILILLRIGALKPDLIRLTNIRFDQLQELQTTSESNSKNGVVSIHVMRRETGIQKADRKRFESSVSHISQS